MPTASRSRTRRNHAGCVWISPPGAGWSQVPSLPSDRSVPLGRPSGGSRPRRVWRRRVAKVARADPIESRVEFEAGPAANNSGLRAVLRRHAPSATRQRTLQANGIDCGAGPTSERGGYVASSAARARLSVPVYVYRREDGSTFEIEQQITADGLVRARSITRRPRSGRSPPVRSRRSSGTRATTPCSRRMRPAGGRRCGCPTSWGPACSPAGSSTATCCTPAGVEYEIAIGIRSARGEVVVAGLGRTERGFFERDRDVLNIAGPGLEVALRATQARGRLVRALADDPAPGTAVILLDHDSEIELSTPDAGRWLAEHFGAAAHPGWLPRPVAEWLTLPPRPPPVSARAGRRLTVYLMPGDPHALLLEETVADIRPDALDRSVRPRARARCGARPPSSRARPSSRGSSS
jgi:hypothetical protein